MTTMARTNTETGRRRLLGAAGMFGGLGLLAVEVRELMQTGGAPGAQNIDRIDSIGYLIWGVGRSWMRERAEELGRHLVVKHGAAGGTVVRALLPLVQTGDPR